jgi:hypothetical protein
VSSEHTRTTKHRASPIGSSGSRDHEDGGPTILDLQRTSVAPFVMLFEYMPSGLCLRNLRCLTAQIFLSKQATAEDFSCNDEREYVR